MNFILDKTTRKSDNEFLNGINNPELSDSDSNDAENLSKKKKNGAEPMNLQESELFDIVQEKSNINQVVEETLSQLPKVDLGEDFDWDEIVNKNTTPSASKDPVNQVNHQIDDVTWSKGHVLGLQVKDFYKSLSYKLHNRLKH